MGTIEVGASYQGQSVTLPLVVLKGQDSTLLDRNWFRLNEAIMITSMPFNQLCFKPEEEKRIIHQCQTDFRLSTPV